MAEKPSILWFVADQMRADTLAHLGNPASITPNLDRLAEEGASFAHAYCQNPVCSPSRCSFLTGLYPHARGHRTMHYLMRPEDYNLLKSMKEAGYEVVWIGRNDVLPSTYDKSEYCDLYFDGTDLADKHGVAGLKPPFGQGMPDVKPSVPDTMEGADLRYSFYVGGFPEHSLDHTFDWMCVKAALKYLDEYRKDSGKPFFIYCTLMFPHPPYMVEEPWFSLIDRSKVPPRRPDIETLPGKASMLQKIRERQGLGGWTEDQYREVRATYLGMVARFDHQLGLVLDKLRERGLWDDTAIFCFSDHGDLTGDYGITEKCQNSFEDPLTNVPLLIKPQAGVPVKTGVHEELAGLVDLPATVADLAGTDLGYVQAGVSLVGALSCGRKIHDAVFCEGGRLHGEVSAMEPAHGPESPYWPRISAQHEEGPAHTKACMMRTEWYKYVMRLYEEDQLYDMEEDPMETRNLIADSGLAQTVRAMRERMLSFYMETADFVPPVMDKR